MRPDQLGLIVGGIIGGIVDENVNNKWHDFDKEILRIADRIKQMRCRTINCYECPFIHSNGWNENCRFSIGGKDFEKWLTLTDKTDEIWRRI